MWRCALRVLSALPSGWAVGQGWEVQGCALNPRVFSGGGGGGYRDDALNPGLGMGRDGGASAKSVSWTPSVGVLGCRVCLGCRPMVGGTQAHALNLGLGGAEMCPAPGWGFSLLRGGGATEISWRTVLHFFF